MSWKGVLSGCFFQFNLSFQRNFSSKVNRSKEKPSHTLCTSFLPACITVIIPSTFTEPFVCAMSCADSSTFVLLFETDNKPSSRWYYCSDCTDKKGYSQRRHNWLRVTWIQWATVQTTAEICLTVKPVLSNSVTLQPKLSLVNTASVSKFLCSMPFFLSIRKYWYLFSWPLSFTFQN